jgi:2-iminobutanoate/2-iminopropanoate deaminase
MQGQVKAQAVNAADAPQPEGGYAQAVLLPPGAQMLFVSGQIPVGRDGAVPSTFADQCRMVWNNVLAQVRAAGMGPEDIVKVTTFLSDRAHAEENSAIRREVLGEHAPALTVVIAEIFDPAWLLEIEIVASRRETK